MTAVDELRRLAEAHGWRLGNAAYSEAETDFRATRGRRRIDVYGDALGRVVSASTSRQYAPRRGTRDWVARVLTGEIPSSPKRM